MTPLSLFREAPIRIRTPWPLVWTRLLCSAVSLAVAVSLTAWRADRYYRGKLQRARMVERACSWTLPLRATLERHIEVDLRDFVGGPDLVFGPGTERSAAPGASVRIARGVHSRARSPATRRRDSGSGVARQSSRGS